jgi:hypothetical protein
VTARQRFRELDEQAVPFDPTDRAHLRARLYHADMMINDGDLLQASRVLLEAYELVGHDRPLDWAELVRHRGHALRFSFLLEGAELLYTQAMRVSADAPALLGKLHTNIAECTCWHDPERALDAAAASTELNIRLGNKIELAKCDTTRAIAFSGLGEIAAARAAVVRARDQAKDIGYPAGEAFALQAGVIVEFRAGHADRRRDASRNLDQVLSRIGTYPHLRALPAWCHQERTAVAEVADGVGWVEEDGLLERISACVAPSRH